MTAAVTRGQSFVQAVLKEISDIVASLDDSQSILDALVGLVSRMLQVDRCSLMLFERGSNVLRIRAGHGMPSSAIKAARVRIGEGIAGWVALHGRPLPIKDVAAHPLFKRRSAPRYRTRSLLSVPLLIGDRVIGVPNVNNGFPLGVEADCRFEATELTLESGDSLVLYTDGITDAVNARGELFGYARFEKVLRAHSGAPGKKLIDAVAKAVTRFSINQPQTDNQTLLVVRKN